MLLDITHHKFKPKDPFKLDLHFWEKGELDKGEDSKSRASLPKEYPSLSSLLTPYSPIFRFWRISPRQLAISRPLMLLLTVPPFTRPTSWCFTNSTNGEQSSSTTLTSTTFVTLRCEMVITRGGLRQMLNS